jgi:PKD repeat protein
VGGSAPIANFTATPTDMMYGATLQLNDTSTNSPTMFNYSFLDGAGTKTWSNGTTLAYQNLTRIMNSGGHYTIQLWAQNAGGGNYSDKQMVIDVRNWSPATMSGTPQSGANPLTVTFTGSSNNATQYYWEFGDTATSAIQNPTHQYTADGVYTVNYGTTNSHHAFNWSNNSGYITVNVTLLADFSGTPTSGILNPTLPVNFVDMSTGDGLYAWTWDFGDTGSSTLRNPSHSYTTPGSYNVKLTTSGSDGTTSKTKNGYITAISNSTAAGGSLNFTPIISSQGGGTIVYQNKTFNLYDQNFTPWPIYLFVAVIGLFFLTVSFIVRRNAEIFAALAIIPLAFTAWSSLAIDMSQSFGMSGMLYNQTASGNMWMLLENHTVYPSVVLAIIFLILSLVAFVQFINELLQGRIIEDKEPEE